MVGNCVSLANIEWQFFWRKVAKIEPGQGNPNNFIRIIITLKLRQVCTTIQLESEYIYHDIPIWSGKRFVSEVFCLAWKEKINISWKMMALV